MSDQFKFAGDMFKNATSPEDKRLAARIWLTDAIRPAMEDGKNVAPALALLSALEGLDFGQVDPMLKLPLGRGKGTKEAAPGSSAVNSLALSAVHILNRRSSRGFLKSIIAGVEEALFIKPGSLAKLRENFAVERSKPHTKRTKYIGLEKDIEKDIARLGSLPDDAIWSELHRVARLIGLQKPS